MNPEIIYEVYSYSPHDIGGPIHTLQLCKSEDTANMLRDWEEASEFDIWYNFSKIAKDWSWESFKLSHGQHFKVGENYLYE